MKMFLFDIDGTLLHTGGAGRIAFERAFKTVFNIPEAWGQTRPDGKTDPIIFQEIAARVLKRRLKSREYRELCSLYTEYFEEEIKNPPSFRLMPSVVKLLQELSRQKDCLLGVATGNFEKAAWAKLRRGGIDSFFSFGGFGSDSSDRPGLTRKALARRRKIAGKRIPANSVCLIGDTAFDILAGKQLGLKTVAVATGKFPRRELKDSDPDHLIENLAKFPKEFF